MQYPFVNTLMCFSLLIVLLLFPGKAMEAQNQVTGKLSEKARISVLTCAPGKELYSVFGHTAIRVSDSKQELDLVFNYGTFDFNTPFFYLKFGHGNLDYLLSVASFKRFMREYFMTNRSVWEQELNLTAQQKERLFNDLLLNAQPENRAYQYDFFYDNCATRVADIILDQFPARSVDFTANKSPDALTFRQAIHPYLASQPWTKLGIDLILGAPADAPTDSLSIMFLPDYLMLQFSEIRIHQDPPTSLVKEENILLDFTDQTEISNSLVSPIILLWILFLAVLLLSAAEAYGSIRLKFLDGILFGITGLLGLVILYLSWISNHQVTSPNWNLLWANPLWLMIITNVNTKIGKFISFGEVILLCIFLVTSFMKSLQFFPSEVYPIVFLLLVRILRPFRWWLGKSA